MKGFAFTLSECSRAFRSLVSSLVSPGPGSSKESHESGAFASELLGSIPWSRLLEDILIVQNCNIFFLRWPTRNGAISTPASAALSMLWLNRWQVQQNRRLRSVLWTAVWMDGDTDTWVQLMKVWPRTGFHNKISSWQLEVVKNKIEISDWKFSETFPLWTSTTSSPGSSPPPQTGGGRERNCTTWSSFAWGAPILKIVEEKAMERRLRGTGIGTSLFRTLLRCILDRKQASLLDTVGLYSNVKKK